MREVSYLRPSMVDRNGSIVDGISPGGVSTHGKLGHLLDQRVIGIDWTKPPLESSRVDRMLGQFLLQLEQAIQNGLSWYVSRRTVPVTNVGLYVLSLESETSQVIGL